MHTFRNWELGHTSPETKCLPAIHDFLGYQPFEAGTTFAENLRYCRRSAGLSQEQLAQRTGLDESTIAKWERGDNLPMPGNLDRLRAFFQSAGHGFAGFESELSYSPARRTKAAARAWLTRRATKAGSTSGCQ